jgi:hypothetical protein
MNPDPARFYRELIASIQDTDLKRCAALMTYHIGEQQAISITSIAIKLFSPQSLTANENDIRKARQVLETLIEDYGIPICSHSGKAGRWLAGTQDEINTAAAERESRAAKLIESARKLRNAKLPANVERVTSAVVQQGLF